MLTCAPAGEPSATLHAHEPVLFEQVLPCHTPCCVYQSTQTYADECKQYVPLGLKSKRHIRRGKQVARTSASPAAWRDGSRRACCENLAHVALRASARESHRTSDLECILLQRDRGALRLALCGPHQPARGELMHEQRAGRVGWGSSGDGLMCDPYLHDC